MAMDIEKLFEDVENFGHLGKDEGAVAASLEVTEKDGKALEFAAVILQKPFIWEGNGEADTGFVERIFFH